MNEDLIIKHYRLEKKMNQKKRDIEYNTNDIIKQKNITLKEISIYFSFKDFLMGVVLVFILYLFNLNINALHEELTGTLLILNNAPLILKNFLEFTLFLNFYNVEENFNNIYLLMIFKGTLMGTFFISSLYKRTSLIDSNYFRTFVIFSIVFVLLNISFHFHIFEGIYFFITTLFILSMIFHFFYSLYYSYNIPTIISNRFNNVKEYLYNRKKINESNLTYLSKIEEDILKNRQVILNDEKIMNKIFDIIYNKKGIDFYTSNIEGISENDIVFYATCVMNDFKNQIITKKEYENEMIKNHFNKNKLEIENT